MPRSEVTPIGARRATACSVRCRRASVDEMRTAAVTVFAMTFEPALTVTHNVAPRPDGANRRARSNAAHRFVASAPPMEGSWERAHGRGWAEGAGVQSSEQPLKGSVRWRTGEAAAKGAGLRPACCAYETGNAR
jgi:hypothetical protein